MSRGEVHDPTPECAISHCYWCDVDEPLNESVYMWCFECGHVYQTARVLRRLFRRNVILESFQTFRQMPWLLPTQFSPSRVQVLWHAVKLRAKNIRFCPLCSHDF